MGHQVSRYDSIWKALKADRASTTPIGVKISAVPKLHARLIKAVIKRKDIDITYKFTWAEKGLRPLKLDVKVDGSVITFRLYHNKMLEGI